MGYWWADVVLAVACLLAGLVHLAASVPGGAGGRLAHAVMGLGMAAMYVPAADPLPPGTWLAVFGGIAAWSAAAAVRARSLAGEAGHHLVGAGAMVFMVLAHSAGTDPAATGGGHHHGGGGAATAGSLGVSALALLLAAWFIADIVRSTGDGPVTAEPRPTARHAAVAVGTRRAVRPLRVARLVMGGTMVAMLLGMA